MTVELEEMLVPNLTREAHRMLLSSSADAQGCSRASYRQCIQGGVLMSAFRIPTLCHSDVIVGLTEDPEMIDGVNRLIFRNYVAAGFWEDNESQMYSNKFLRAPTRHVFTITQSG